MICLIRTAMYVLAASSLLMAGCALKRELPVSAPRPQLDIALVRDSGLTCTVIRVDRTKNPVEVQIDCGTRDGLRLGDKLVVSNGGFFVASIDIKHIEGNRATGVITLESCARAVEVGHSAIIGMPPPDLELPEIPRKELLGEWRREGYPLTTLTFDDANRFRFTNHYDTFHAVAEGTYELLNDRIMFESPIGRRIANVEFLGDRLLFSEPNGERLVFRKHGD
jgi:hypothetical protein